MRFICIIVVSEASNQTANLNKTLGLKVSLYVEIKLKVPATLKCKTQADVHHNKTTYMSSLSQLLNIYTDRLKENKRWFQRYFFRGGSGRELSTGSLQKRCCISTLVLMKQSDCRELDWKNATGKRDTHLSIICHLLSWQQLNRNKDSCYMKTSLFTETCITMLMNNTDNVVHAWMESVDFPHVFRGNLIEFNIVKCVKPCLTSTILRKSTN